MVNCSILGCNSRSERKHENITFHTFPKNLAMREVWVNATVRQNWKPTKYTRICSKHFEISCFRKTEKLTFLRPNSIPKLFVHDQNKETVVPNIENIQPGTSQGSVMQPSATECTPRKRKLFNAQSSQSFIKMGEPDGEIEYLDEDADIVQQCVITPNVEVPVASRPISKSPLLVERKRRIVTSSHHSAQKRKKDVDDDEDYDPRNDAGFKIKKRSYPTTHKKLPQYNRIKAPTDSAFSSSRIEVNPQKIVSTAETVKQKLQPKPKANLKPDKQSNEIVKIYDYQDPFCIQDKPFVGDEEEMAHIKDWNRLCVNQLKKHEQSLIPDNSNVVSSRKSLIFRNVCNSLTGKQVPTVWSRLTINNRDGKLKSEGFESILPNFTTQKVDFEISTPVVRNQKNQVSSNCVLLTKEEHKDGDVLVGYKPQEAVVFIFKSMEENFESEGQISKLKYLEEKLQCQICSSCYQYSWRGVKQEKIGKRQIKCGICGRGFVNIYNFLSHLSSHSANEVKMNRKLINRTLVEILGYHYKCRICQKNTSTIKELRKHMLVHKGSKQFFCEVGNHLTT